MKIYKLLPVIVFITCGLYYTHFNPSLAQSYMDYATGGGGEPGLEDYSGPDATFGGGEPGSEGYSGSDATFGGGEPGSEGYDYDDYDYDVCDIPDYDDDEGFHYDDESNEGAEGLKPTQCTFMILQGVMDYCKTFDNLISNKLVPIDKKVIECDIGVEGQQCGTYGKIKKHCTTRRKQMPCHFHTATGKLRNGLTIKEHGYTCACSFPPCKKSK